MVTKASRWRHERSEFFIIKIVIACIPTAIVGVLLDDKINLLFYNFQSVVIVHVVFGILYIVVENYNKGKSYNNNDNAIA